MAYAEQFQSAQHAISGYSFQSGVEMSQLKSQLEAVPKKDDIIIQKTFGPEPEKKRGRRSFRFLLILIFGVFGVIAPFASIYIATFLGKTDISMFNSTMVMLLSVLLIVFLLINCFGELNSKHYKGFAAGIVFLLISLISFMFNLVIFINL